ncbi:DUF4253 domain-containing protein [Streptomyces aculeolatus]
MVEKRLGSGRLRPGRLAHRRTVSSFLSIMARRIPRRTGRHKRLFPHRQGRRRPDNDTAAFAAVVRDWEDRFGARVVGVGFSTLHLSVAAPPAGIEDAVAVAAEHFAFCPDNVWQGTHDNLTDYAENLVNLNCWDFWWD